MRLGEEMRWASPASPSGHARGAFSPRPCLSSRCWCVSLAWGVSCWGQGHTWEAEQGAEPRLLCSPESTSLMISAESLVVFPTRPRIPLRNVGNAVCAPLGVPSGGAWCPSVPGWCRVLTWLNCCPFIPSSDDCLYLRAPLWGTQSQAVTLLLGVLCGAGCPAHQFRSLQRFTILITCFQIR